MATVNGAVMASLSDAVMAINPRKLQALMRDGAKRAFGTVARDGPFAGRD